MEFDKSRVYTSLNADKLKVGSKVIVADSLGMLRTRVENLKTKEDEKNLITTIRGIKDENYQHRFVEQDNVFWNLAYLVAEPEEKKLKWTDLKIGDIIRQKEGTISYLITGIDTNPSENKHIFADGIWCLDSDIERDWEKVEQNGDK